MVFDVFVVFQGECFVSIGREMTLVGKLVSWEGLRVKEFVCLWEVQRDCRLWEEGSRRLVVVVGNWIWGGCLRDRWLLKLKFRLRWQMLVQVHWRLSVLQIPCC